MESAGGVYVHLSFKRLHLSQAGCSLLHRTFLSLQISHVVLLEFVLPVEIEPVRFGDPIEAFLLWFVLLCISGGKKRSSLGG